MTIKTTLPTDSAARKRFPLARGPLAYAPAAFAGMSRICINGNDKHNPGEALHHARGKSSDHPDCILRHLMDVQDIVAALDRGDQSRQLADGEKDQLREEVDQLMWRAAIFAQEIHEKYLGAPLAPGARLPPASAPVLDYAHELPKPGTVTVVCGNVCRGAGGYVCERLPGHEGIHRDIRNGAAW